MFFKKIIVFTVFIFVVNLLNASSAVDSLLFALPRTTDTGRINTLIKISICYENSGETPLAKKYGLQAVDVALNGKKSFELAKVYLHMGGRIYNNIGDFTSALQYLFLAIEEAEKINDLKLLYKISNALGNTYMGQKNFNKAIESYDKAFEFAKKTHDNYSESITLVGKGNVYAEQHKYEKALDCYSKSLFGFLLTQAEYESCIAQASMGNVYLLQGKYKQAIVTFNDLLPAIEKQPRKYGYGQTLLSLGNAYREIGDYKTAKLNYYKSVQIFKMLSDKFDLGQVYKELACFYNKQHVSDSSFYYMQMYSDVKDSLYNEQNAKLVAEMQTKYETVKKEEENKALLIQNRFSTAKIQEQTKTQIGLGLFLITAFIFSLFLYRGNKQKQKKNQIISQQKKVVELKSAELELKNREITDSISYAKRIQQAILPSKRLIKEYFVDVLIYYQPKDIVAGDFYWVEKKGDLILFAAADCTGHGVPGAMVSVICNNALNRALREFNLIEPGKLLDKTRELVIEQFEKSDENVMDGMDISLCVLNNKTLELMWAGANNPLWLWKNQQLIEIKADKQPIGKYVKSSPFTTHTFQLQKGDSIYIFSDGYADQFGGTSGKKFKYKELKKILVANAHFSMNEQKLVLQTCIKNWMKNLEQVDDILVVGVRV